MAILKQENFKHKFSQRWLTLDFLWVRVGGLFRYDNNWWMKSGPTTALKNLSKPKDKTRKFGASVMIPLKAKVITIFLYQKV